ncbi:MAG: LON peptidase substrate-binding domain-containing protein [Bacteroidota bacterium]
MDFLPLFPLSLVVYPGEKLRLHIFEPRYRQLTDECLQQGTTFGIPPVVEQEISTLATEVEVVSLDKKYPGGEMDITTRGKRRLKIEEFFRKSPGKLYPAAQVSWLPDINKQEPYLQNEVFKLLQSLHQVLGIPKRVVNVPEEVTAFEIGHHIGFNLQEEAELLGFNQETERLQYIHQHLERILPIVTEAERLKARARLNGHYKNLIPPEF